MNIESLSKTGFEAVNELDKGGGGGTLSHVERDCG